MDRFSAGVCVCVAADASFSGCVCVWTLFFFSMVMFCGSWLMNGFFNFSLRPGFGVGEDKNSAEFLGDVRTSIIIPPPPPYAMPSLFETARHLL